MTPSLPVQSRTCRPGSKLSKRSKNAIRSPSPKRFDNCDQRRCCLDLMEAMDSEFSLTEDQRECIEQLGRFLREGIGKLTALSERVADGDIVVLC
ncbi:DUF7364 domain-containing protein [Pseudomonas aeruginosa]|uniref:DUF7364 domain-containing protein n=1 Tax=Pseudomonas aeruginosa TaxID=287 RepID=UPI003D76920D